MAICGSPPRATPTGWPIGWPRRSDALHGVRLPLPVQANEVFAIVPRTLHERWRASGARYLEWPGEGPGTDVVAGDETFIRLVTSFQTTEADVQALVGAADASPAA